MSGQGLAGVVSTRALAPLQSPVRTCISVPGTCSLVASNRTPIVSPQWVVVELQRVGIQPHPALSNPPQSPPSASQPAQVASPNLGHANSQCKPRMCRAGQGQSGRAGQAQHAACMLAAVTIDSVQSSVVVVE